MLLLIAKGIIRSYSMRQRRNASAVKPKVSYPIVLSLVDSCLMHSFTCMNDAYFAPSAIRFPYELKRRFDWILHELQYLDKVHPHHFTLDLDQLDRILEYRFIQSSSFSFPVYNVELECMFDTLGFLWLHHDRPPYLLYLLEKLVDGLSDETTTFNYYYY